MRLGNVADEGQAQATSFCVVYERISRSIELLEDLRLITPRDADAVIRHLESHNAVVTV